METVIGLKELFLFKKQYVLRGQEGNAVRAREGARPFHQGQADKGHSTSLNPEFGTRQMKKRISGLL